MSEWTKHLIEIARNQEKENNRKVLLLWETGYEKFNETLNDLYNEYRNKMSKVHEFADNIGLTIGWYDEIFLQYVVDKTGFLFKHMDAPASYYFKKQKWFNNKFDFFQFVLFQLNYYDVVLNSKIKGNKLIVKSCNVMFGNSILSYKNGKNVFVIDDGLKEILDQYQVFFDIKKTFE